MASPAKKPQYTFKMKAAINDVAAIQPAVGGGAAVAAPAVGGLAPAIGAGGGGGCHPGSSGDGAAPAAPAAAPAIGAGAGGGSSGDGAASAAEEPFPEAEIAAAMIADGFKQYHMAAPTAAALPAVGGHESPMEPAVPPPAPAPALAPVGGDDDDERWSNWSESEVVASSSLPAVAVGNRDHRGVRWLRAFWPECFGLCTPRSLLAKRDHRGNIFLASRWRQPDTPWHHV